MIQSRLKELMAQRERRIGERVTYAAIHKATGIWPRTLSTLATNNQKMVALDTLDRLCAYFECEVGDLLVYVPVE